MASTTPPTPVPDASLLFTDGDLAAEYARSRPDYPPAVWDAVESYAREHGASLGVAADVATGTGQAARGLARLYTTVLGIDASPAQVEAGRANPPAPNVDFCVGTAEATGLGDASVDAVVVAEALHWFDTAAFWAEAHRVLRPGGILAIVGYSGSAIMNNAPADAAFRELFYGLLGPHWHPNKMVVDRLYVDEGYQPPVPPFADYRRVEGLAIERSWGVAEAVGNCRSWSGYTSYLKTHGLTRGGQGDPALALAKALTRALPAAGSGDSGEGPFKFVWPTMVMLARKPREGE